MTAYHSILKAQMATTLTHERLTELLDYNPLTGDFTWKVFRNYNADVGSKAGWLDGKGYRRLTLDNKCYRCSRLAWFYMYAVWPKHTIDHKNRVRTDDRIDNLRSATHKEQVHNKNTKPPKGVKKEKSGRWTARIRHFNKHIHLGTFDTFEQASKVYQDMKENLHKEYELHGN